jgi:hypothetical protein
MKKIITIASVIAFSLSTTACGYVDRMKAHYTGDASETCHDGIVYLQFTSGASVKIDRNTLQPAKCNK